MNAHAFPFAGTTLSALPSGALWWEAERLLCVSDLHLGKSERIARRGGTMLPPYETRDTLSRLDADIAATGARTVVCLGDSFDDLLSIAALDEDERLWLARLQAGRDWIWIEGNHDAGPIDLGGTHRSELRLGPLAFRHAALPSGTGEISGHYHPKARVVVKGRLIARPCFLVDVRRVMLPAYGTYTGGLGWTDPVLARLFGPGAQAFLTGPAITVLPLPRTEAAR